MKPFSAFILQIKKPRWVVANFVETTQAATENVLKGLERGNKKQKNDLDKKLKTEMSPSTRNEHSYANVNGPAKEKLPRDVFGATILPSNLSFDNMKKLSMNQIKLEEIPLVDEDKVAEILVAEKMSKAREAQAARAGAAEEEKKKKKAAAAATATATATAVAAESDYDSLMVPVTKDRTLGRIVDFSRTDPYERIPGPAFFTSVTTTLKNTFRQMTLYFILQLLRTNTLGPLKKYGPLVRLPEIFGGKILLINRPEHISAVFEQDKQLPTASCLDTLECSRQRRRGKLKNLNTISVTEWEETRKAIDDVLLKDEEKYFDGLEESGNQLVRRIRSLRNRENEVPEDFICEVNKWSLECLFQALFDKSFGFLDPEKMKEASKNLRIYSALREATRCLHMCEEGFQLWRFMNTPCSSGLDTACQTVEEILSQHVYQSQINLLNKDDDLKSEPLTFTEGMLLVDGMKRPDIVTNLLDTLLIGMNSISNSLSFLLYHLSQNPRAQHELLKEIKEILPEKYSRLEYDQLSSLKYLQACLKESLRLKMPMPILTKYLTRDVILSNFQIPRGTLVLMAAQMEALREENFERANEFQPRRWLDPENKKTFPSHPLASHSQNTFEKRMAEVAVMTCTAQIIRNFNVEFHHGSLNATICSVSCPKNPLKFSFLERED